MEVTLEQGVCFSYLSSDKLGATIICDEEYPRRVAIDLMYKMLENFNEFVFTNKINLQSISKDTLLKFKYLDALITEWQNPNDSK